MDYTDIFKLAAAKKSYKVENECFPLQNESIATRWKILECPSSDYYPFIFNKNGVFDLEHASNALMSLHRQYLGIKNNKIRVEIDPFISL